MEKVMTILGFQFKLKKNSNKHFRFLVHLHLYYHEQLDFMIEKLKNIQGCDWDLYVTINENNEESKKIAYTFFRVASKYNNDALQSLAYCKFEGIGVKKNIKDAFDILYVNKLGNELTVLKSNISEGIPYQPQKSKVAKNVKRKHQKKALSEVARNIFLYIFALPAFLIFGFVIDNEYKIKNAGGYEVDEALRGNAMGGALLTILACIAWPYFLCSACSALVVYLAGMEEGYWKWGFIIGILPTLIIYWIFSKINLKSYFK
jgi:hypothetical protein